MKMNKIGESREEQKLNTSFTFRVPGTSKNTVHKIEEKERIEKEVRRKSDLKKQ